MEKEEKWYVAQAAFMTEAIREQVKELDFETFVPVLKTNYEGKVNGKTVQRTANKLLTFNYVFIRGVRKDIEDCLKGITRIHLLYNRPGVAPGKSYGVFERKPMVVSDREMQMFIKTVSLYQNGAPVSDVPEVELQKGDYVRITGGPFEGVEGTLVTRKGKEGGKVVVSVSHLVSVATFDIEPQYIQVLKFSQDNKHIYRKMDNFMPKAKEMLARRKSGGELTSDERDELQSFINSYSCVETDTLNTGAKLKTLIFMAYAALSMDNYAAELFQVLKNEFLPKIKSARLRTLMEEQMGLYTEICS